VQERERIIRQQQEPSASCHARAAGARTAADPADHWRSLSHRAHQLTDSCFAHPRQRAKVVVIDITGVPSVDSNRGQPPCPNRGCIAFDGSTVIVTGLSSEIAQTLVTIGVDLTKMKAVGDLQVYRGSRTAAGIPDCPPGIVIERSNNSRPTGGLDLGD